MFATSRRVGIIVSVITVMSLGYIVSSAPASSNVFPVIMIPGDGGSQIDAKLSKSQVVHYVCEKNTNDFFNIWLNLELLVPIVIDCWVDNIKLVYNSTTRKTETPLGVETRVPGFGDPAVVEWLDPSQASPGAYFKDIGNMLVQHGFNRNTSLRGAPYDFRRAPNEHQEFFKAFKVLVEETYNMNGKKAVILIAHSMGGPMTLVFLQQQSQKWKDQYIRAFVTLSGAWGGSVKALKVFAVGDDLGSYVLRESILREMQITSPSLSWLLPSPLFWKESEVLVQTGNKNYTINNLKAFFDDINYPLGWEMRKDVEPYSLNFSPPGVEVHCLHGFGVDTVDRLVYKSGKFPDGYPTFINGDGDGTVNKRSLEGCLHWASQQKKKIYHQTFPKVDHMGILRDTKVLEYLQQLITDKLE
ncbi:hypothetical protein FOCC_FOCC005555 [Frankliniella occidentalis]|uniref:Phospholipase A2 group XV n=1 Tax=Frankliniella occidentalis TaxID=133901 RepID=A0A6J1TI82_FRAOC|nr:phospholipase A2 group XV [Frankliniella occidentalis]KAE8747732.1 hypothetical protein FOCC_FOCC005555 [Frankliniella occidentalis]